MKQPTLRKQASVIMICLMIFSTISSNLTVPLLHAAEKETLATWDITGALASSTVLASGGVKATIPVAVSGAAVSKGAELSTNTIYTAGSGSNDSMRTTGWNNGANEKYFKIILSSKGYENLTFSAKTKSSSTGPKNFAIQYSTDGITFKELGTYQNTDKIIQFDAVTLPKNASNSDTLIIRLIMTDNVSVNGSQVEPGGASNINNILIQGTRIADSSIVEDVEASKKSGAIFSTDFISLSCKTPGAVITYSINNGAFISYSEPFLIEKFPAVLKVKAHAEGLTDSTVQVYDYTQAKVAAVTTSSSSRTIHPDKKIELNCSTKGAEIQYSLDGGKNWSKYTGAFQLAELPAKVTAKATLNGALDSPVSEFDFAKRTAEKYSIYFGQIHSHSTNSDGLGSVEEAFYHAAHEVYNMDFLAVTDHSNSLEEVAGTANILDGSSSAKWKRANLAADEATTKDFVGISAYEMTWSNGTGHMNTFKTNGFENRNVAKYKSADGLLNYYEALKKAPNSISMFNHPGDTFGDFKNFSYLSPEMDSLINLIEVGNGEGPVHGSGYFPSYEYYTRALDKGWHVAPTNNQDNHKGLWGDANTARSVVLVDSLTRENIYDAMKNQRVYATEDNNLNIYYTLNNEIMGSKISKSSKVDIKVELEDEGKTSAVVKAGSVIQKESVGKVEVVANGGKVVASKNVPDSKGTVEFALDADYSYYYIRVTQEDKDIAVTAPVWVGEMDKAGISNTSSTIALPAKGEPIDVTTTLFNNEEVDMNVKSLEYFINGKVVHKADIEKNGLKKVAHGGLSTYRFEYISNSTGTLTMDVKMVAEIKGVEKVFADVFKTDIADPSLISRIVIDGSHRNDYVNGYYSGNMSAFINLGAKSQTQIKIATEITDELLKQANALMISAPLKKSDFSVDGVKYDQQEFSDEFIAMVKRYVDRGGNLIICGLADYQDDRNKDKPYQSSTQLNKLLKGIGATTRINNDQLTEIDNKKQRVFRLYFSDYNTDSKHALLKGIEKDQKYSFYSGCSVIPDPAAMADGRVTWLVKGHETTESTDTSNTLPAVAMEKGGVYALASEKLAGGGSMLIGGTVFNSNFELEPKAGVGAYANSVIVNNFINSVQKKIPVTAIAEARKGKIGDIFTVEGYVTAGTKAGNAFYDTIYVQDETGGMDIYPVNEEGILPGQKMRIIGRLDSYQGDLELRVIRTEKISEEIKPVKPAELTAKEAMDYKTNGGKLVKVSGRVTERILANNILSAFKVKDASGVEARVLIDGYILDSTGKDKLDSIIKVGNQVSVIGIVYYNPDGVNLRVRDRAEIKLENINVTDSGEPVITPTSTQAPATANPVKPVVTVNILQENWKEAIEKVAELVRNEKSNPGAGKATAVMVLQDKMCINTNVLATAKGANIDLIFENTAYKWTINGTSITDKVTALKDIDLTVTEMPKGKSAVKAFDIKYDGTLPFKGKLTLNTRAEYKNKVLFLSNVNNKTGKLEPCSYRKADSEGKVTFPFKHCSKYVITIKNPVKLSVVKKKTLENGKQYKIGIKGFIQGDKVSFSSDKKAVATVNGKGIIIAKKDGKATITTKVIQNGKKYTLKTKVKVK